MNLKVYIVKQGTPESRLLSRAGFDRTELPVAEWRGKRRSHGGYGSRPVAWRVEGEENIRQLCEALCSIIGGKKPSRRTAQEQSTLDRVIATLKALADAQTRKQRALAITADLSTILRLYLCRHYPAATPEEIEKATVNLAKSRPGSLEELRYWADALFKERVAIWAEARRAFVRVMTIYGDSGGIPSESR